MTRERLSKAEFVVAWQRSESLDDVVSKTKLKLITVKKYAYRMRRQGVPLKALEGESKRTLDFAYLAKLAREVEASTVGDEEQTS